MIYAASLDFAILGRLFVIPGKLLSSLQLLGRQLLFGSILTLLLIGCTDEQARGVCLLFLVI